MTFCQILSTNPVRKCIEINVRDLYVDIAAGNSLLLQWGNCDIGMRKIARRINIPLEIEVSD